MFGRSVDSVVVEDEEEDEDDDDGGTGVPWKWDERYSYFNAPEREENKGWITFINDRHTFQSTKEHTFIEGPTGEFGTLLPQQDSGLDVV